MSSPWYDAIAEKLTQRSDIQQAAAANSPENFGLILAKEFQDGVLDQLGVAEDMALSYIDSPAMQVEILAAYLPFIQGKAKVAHQEHCDIVDLLGPDKESAHLEYKASLRTHQDSGETFKPLETASLKTIAAFLNSREGGTLLIGVADDGHVHGLAGDYASLHKPGKDDCDRFLLHLNQLLVNALGETVASTIVSRLHTVDGGDVCRVHVPPSRFPVEAHVVVDQGGQLQKGTAFCIRTGNATIEITKPAERQKYLANRWCTTTSGRGASA